MIIKLQNGDKLKIESDEKREARRKYKEHSLLSIGLKLKRNLNIASNFLKSGPNITNFGNAISALFGGYSPENPDVTKGDPPAVGIKNFENLVRTARVAREFNNVVKGPVNLFKLLNNFIEKFVTNPKGSGKLVHYDKGNGKSIYQENRGASIINNKLVPGKTKREGLKDYTWWNTDNPYMNVHKAKEGPLSPTRYIVVDENALFKHPFDLKEPVGQSAGKGRGFILPTERVTDKPVDLTNAEIYEKNPFGWWERIKVLPTSEITKSKQSRLISSDTYPLYRGPRFNINEIVNSNGTVNPRKAMLALHTVAKQFGKGAYKMEHRLENPEWHKEDPNTYEHTKRVAQSAWRLPTPKGYTKLDLMIAALGHDFGKIVSGDGHAQIGADLAKQVFIGIKPHLLQAIREHMGLPTTQLGEVTKAADMLNGRAFSYLLLFSPELYNKVFIKPRVGPEINRPVNIFLKPHTDNRYKREDVLIGDEWGANLYSYPEYIKYRISKLKQIVPDKIEDYTVPKLDPKEVNLKKAQLISRDNFIRNNIGFNPMAIMSMGKNLKTHLWEINRRLSKLYPDLPKYATEGISNAENTPFIIGYFNEPNIVGFHSLMRGINLVEPSPKSNLPRTMLHEGVMHGTDSYMTKQIANAYLLFINKIYESPYIEDGTYIKNSWPYKAPKGTERWEEGRATFGEIRKFLYDKISKDNNILFSPENMNKLIPIFEKTVDKLNINDVVDLFNKTGGYGEVYGTIGPKANSNFLKDSKDLLKYMPATIPFLISRKEEKK